MGGLHAASLGMLALSLTHLSIPATAAGITGEPAPLSSSVAPATVVTPSDTATGTRSYPGDARNEPLLVGAEDQRLIRVRAAAVAARMRGEKLVSPYEVAIGSSRTLVLTARPAPYTVQDLAGLAPETFVHEPDGTYLLSENVMVQAGADLALDAPGGLNLHLASAPSGFVSIVNDGGKLEITGTADAPARVGSWDPVKGAPDSVTSDGRAYLRSIGGMTTIAGAHIESLGFWSGRTGGLALTGTDRPTTTSSLVARPPKVPGSKPPVAPAPESVRKLAADPGPLPDNFASGSIQDTTITGNAYGIFTSKSRGMEVRNVTVQNSLVDGVVLHRFVTGARIIDTAASHNAGNGFVLARATAGITLTGATADFNGRSGILIKGIPLAEGPSAGGDPGTSSSDQTVSGSHTGGNLRYGIEVTGGRKIGLHANTIAGNDRGIDISRSAAFVTIAGNRFENQKTRSVSVVDGAPDTLIAGNNITGGTTGIYLRNSPGQVTRNTMTGLTLHGITINGSSPVQLHGNTIGGSGPSALNLRDSHSSVVRSGNDTQGWVKTEPFWARVANFFQPLTVIWTLLAFILILTAFKGRRGRRKIVHPYASQAPLATFTASHVRGPQEGPRTYAGEPDEPGPSRSRR
ncbi:right-handed parallel beta-helix repeat-containing protein [Arthrobacter sp. MMS18-M83]|uniref:right-handed parallel beta-helix repeat-containing protein n=1 Tax=Arthrobacter sp. MMS18-M83 TaxID=2996261 RepID=UPI00227BCD37|nr:right-handed parallel beta-helix repeat-containing protein [Arthrobacter sp. MMS18-M83]WAH97265.1 right-handed parallel beta-helix repeat-containing protein [Arthrobacter sp. MMS18-M83]